VWQLSVARVDCVEQCSSASRERPAIRSYLTILRVPGAAAFSLSALLARTGGSMMGIGIVLMVSSLYGSYGWAGALTAANGVGWAVGNAVLSNLVDRFGQRRIMLPSCLVANASVLAIALAGWLQAPIWLLFIPAVAAGAFGGSPGALSRTRWKHVLPSAQQLHTAFSLEATFDEITYVVGPVLATALATLIHPTAGLVVPGILGGVGGVLFYHLQRASEPPVAPREQASGLLGQRFILAIGGVAPVVAAMLCVGMAFGSIDVSTVAAATAWGQRSWSGAILAAMSLASAFAGLSYGLRAWVLPLWQRFAITITCFAGGVWLLLFAHSPLVLALAGFIAGFTVAPTLINSNSLIGVLVPGNRLTEGLSWVGTSIGIGASIGSAISGRMIDAFGYHAGYYTVITAGMVGALIVLGCTGLLRRYSGRRS
jgi:MFS family permease